MDPFFAASAHFLRRSGVRAVLLFLLFPLLWATVPQTAFAVGAGCRTDPIVVLSNGRVLRITVEIDSAASSVQSVDYTLHTPKGVQVVFVVYTGGVLKNKETLRALSDAAPRSYVVETIVNSSAKLSVKATSTLRELKATATGLSGERLLTLLQQ